MDEEDDPTADELITCWCGAQGTFAELFDDALYEEDCGGSGVLYCYCGGDQCVCHHHGETECPGCADCAPEDFDDDYDPDDYDDDK